MELKVGYWSIRGLGAPLRMMCEHAQVPYEAVLYDVAVTAEGFDRSCWFGPKAAIKAKNPLANLPYIIDGDTVVTQSNACMTYLGKKFGLLGATEIDFTDCQQCLCEIMDFRNDCVRVFYGGGDLSRLMASPSLGKLASWLEFKGTTFLVGSSPTAPVRTIVRRAYQCVRPILARWHRSPNVH